MCGARDVGMARRKGGASLLLLRAWFVEGLSFGVGGGGNTWREAVVQTVEN
jgi:hypothetical protein